MLGKNLLLIKSIHLVSTYETAFNASGSQEHTLLLIKQLSALPAEHLRLLIYQANQLLRALRYGLWPTRAMY